MHFRFEKLVYWQILSIFMFFPSRLSVAWNTPFTLILISWIYCPNWIRNSSIIILIFECFLFLSVATKMWRASAWSWKPYDGSTDSTAKIRFDLKRAFLFTMAFCFSCVDAHRCMLYWEALGGHCYNCTNSLILCSLQACNLSTAKSKPLRLFQI